MADQRLLLAQSIFPRLNCSQYLTSADYRDSIQHLAVALAVGGFVLFDGDVECVERVTTELQQLVGGSLLFAADCEDGVTMRFAGGTEFPSMMALGSSEDVAATYSVARSIAREMRSLGIFWNFAPVADVNTNPDNPIINIRSFGSTPERVADHVHAYIRGMQDGGVVATAKHFPGHGDTAVDSHLAIPVVNADRKRLDAVELFPFREAIRQGVKSVMVSHVALPAIDEDLRPATLSSAIVTGLLRNEMGFEGVVVTDAMDMHAIANEYTSGVAAVTAYHAGCDVIEIPADPIEAFNALVHQAETKKIKTRRLKDTAGRIASLKKWTTSFGDETLPSASVRRGHEVIAMEAARRAIQVTGRMRTLIPPLMVLAVTDTEENPKPSEWFNYFSAWYPGEASGVIVTPELSDEDRVQILAGIDRAGSVLLALFVKPRGFSGNVGLSEDQLLVVEHGLARPVIVANFGNPYLLREAEPNVRIDTFSASSASLAASIEALSRAVK